MTTYMTTQEAAQVLHLSVTRVADMCNKRQLKAHKVREHRQGGSWVWQIDADDVYRELARRKGINVWGQRLAQHYNRRTFSYTTKCSIQQARAIADMRQHAANERERERFGG